MKQYGEFSELTDIQFRQATGGAVKLLSASTRTAGTQTLSLPDLGSNTISDVVAALAATQTLTNKTLTAPVIATISNTGTLTLPTATDTLVARTTTDTLTNKSISGATNTITNVSLTTGVTGTLPVANGGSGTTTSTGTGSVVLSASPTLTTPALGTPTAIVLTSATGLPLTTGVTGTLGATNGGTSQSTYTTGDLLYSSASNVLSKLPIGTAGQALVVSGGIPAWSTAGTGTVTSVAATVPAFLSIAGSPVTTSGTLAISLSGTALPVANGGTGVTSVTVAPTATAFAGWDANSNLSANNHLAGYATTATAAGTTTLVVGSAQQQFFTGTTTQTVKLPVTSTLVLGQTFLIANKSTGVVTVQSSGANTILAMSANTYALFTVILTSGTGTASWSLSLLPGQLQGTATNDSASAGNVGEYMESFNATSTAWGTASGTIADAATLTLTAGDWDVYGQVVVVRNGAVFSSTDVTLGVDGASGNSQTTPLVFGRYNESGRQNVGFTNYTVQTPVVRVQSNGTDLIIGGITTSGSQVVRLKLNVASITSGQAQIQFLFRARRVR